MVDAPHDGKAARLGDRAEREHGSKARAIVVSGRVQGVGFRPFVHRLATRLNIKGNVRNISGQVLIHAEGTTSALDDFETALVRDAPSLSRPVVAGSHGITPSGAEVFQIEASQPTHAAEIHLPPDQSICADCLAELLDPGDRRHRYPFINCTACGPRYTIIDALPYDRASTTMAVFAMCPACQAEYETPGDRRFHAEPVACPECGPRLSFKETFGEAPPVTDREEAIATALAQLRLGRIVAVRGVGGYHLMVDAADDVAVRRLRRRKKRPHKPLAVMFPVTGNDGLDAVRRSVTLDEEAATSLLDPARPIVLLPRREDCPLSPSLAPDLGELGVFLPYSPLHHLLLDGFGAPLVATSGNISGEPVITSVAEAEARLSDIADAFLHHDRDIVRPADDPVVRFVAGATRPIRLGRGTAPLEVPLAIPLEKPVLAVGGQGKVTVAIGIGGQAIVSPHIGDLDTPRGLDQLARLAADLPRLYRAEPAVIACDLHPGYGSARWARRQRLPVLAVQHHAAHASALAAEHPDVARWLVFAWDGVGFGDDATLWGGEALLGAPGAWRRVASFRPFRPPGGDLAAHAPWRSAAGLLWESGRDFQPPPRVMDGEMIRKAWQAHLNAPATSAVGRLFDAAAALLGIADETSFEGQAAMRLEHLAASHRHEPHPSPVTLPLVTDTQGLPRCDWQPLLAALTDEDQSRAERALLFHLTLAEALVAQVRDVHTGHAFEAVGLTGGVFQNRVLAKLAIERLGALGYRVELPRLTPAGDGGLSLGQVVEAAARIVAAGAGNHEKQNFRS